MNAQVAEVVQIESNHKIQTIERKLREAEAKLPAFQKAQNEAEARLSTAEKKRSDNQDPEKARELSANVRRLQGELEDHGEPVLVALKNIEELKRQLEAARAAARHEEFQRPLEEWRKVHGGFDEQKLTAQTKQNELANSMMARLHALDHTFAPCLQHGNPSFLPGGDILLGNLLPSIEITDTRATATWLRVPNRIKN